MAAAVLWGVGAVVARSLFDDGVHALELTEARAVLAAAGLALVPSSWRRAEVGAAAAPRLRLAVVALGLALGLVNATYYSAVSRIPVAAALVIQYTAPALIVAWVAVRRRRAPSPQVSAAVVIALVGVVLVVDLPGSVAGRMDGFGLALAGASAVFFASYTVLAERVSATFGATGAMFRGFVVAALFWSAYQAPHGFPHDLLASGRTPRVLYVGLAGTLLPFLLYAVGVRRISAERASIVATLEPVVAAIVAWGWLDQSLTVVQGLGGVLVIGAVVALQGRRHPGPMQTLYDAAGGRDGMVALAEAWHRRVLADELAGHPFKHGYSHEHTERLAAYWAEALGGPAAYSERYGNETSVVRIHSGNGQHEEMDGRAIACFDQALVDAGLAADDRLRQALHDYFSWATTTAMARYPASADDVPDGLTIPRWSWDGLVDGA